MAKKTPIVFIGMKAFRTNMEWYEGQLKHISQQLYEDWARIWAEAASEFVQKAVQKTYVLTGMSAASYWPLARAIAKGSDAASLLAISAVEAKVNERSEISLHGMAEMPYGRRNKAKFQSARSGRGLGRKAYTLNFGSRYRPNFGFRFMTLVFQQAIHEPKWQAIVAGTEAFDDYISKRWLSVADFHYKRWTERKKVQPWIGSRGAKHHMTFRTLK